MAEKFYTVKVQGDHLQRLASAKPLQALAELIWNSLDADADRVEVIIHTTDLGHQAITVRDDGHGVPHAEAHELFTNLGGSWKIRKNRSKTKSRLLHGKEGKGRFKALSLGRVADWNITYKDDEKTFKYTMTILHDNLLEVRISDPHEVKDGTPGVEVNITDIYDYIKALDSDSVMQELSEIFAIYLSDYKDVVISKDGFKLDPSSSILKREKFDLNSIDNNGKQYPVELELIEWKSATERILYLCTESGFPLKKIQPRFHTPGFQFSAYLKSKYFSELHEKSALDLDEMEPNLSAAYEEARDRIKECFRQRELESAQLKIDHWKTDKVYPYHENPTTVLEDAERKVFDIVALNVNKHLPGFSDSDNKTKKFQFRMLRQAIERGPEELRAILTEVLGLPKRKQLELAKLLEEASLANIISASKLVADRLKFLKGLDLILFDEKYKKSLKERSQLHRIIADNNTWIFGEAFSVAVDDRSLTEALRKHIKLSGSDVVVDEPVTDLDGKKGLVDLMLSRSVPSNQPNEREHLVVELKRPAVKVGSKEIEQVKKYAFAVAEDTRFESLDVTWSFWVISNALSTYAKHEANQSNRPKGQIYKSSDGKIEIWVKSWAQILGECHSRLRFVEEKIKLKIDREDSLRYLQETYAKYLSGVLETEEEEIKTEDSEVAESAASA